MHRIGVQLVALILIAIAQTGCMALAPAIESFQNTGVMESDRVRLLSKDLKEFHDARFWGDPSGALVYCLPEAQPAMQKMLRKSRQEERIVEHRIDSVEFTEESYKANVEVKVRAFRVPYYVVEDRLEIQKWRFTLADGWKLTEYEISKDT